MKKLSEYSHAKINAFLHIVGKKENGYHLLESIFLPINIADKITITENKDIQCLVHGAEITDNICTKIAKALAQKFAVDKGALIEIEKNIPISAGLGGGSSNAATTLKLLCKLWNIEMSQQEMIDFSTPIGADIPFFIVNKPAVVAGIGEFITPIEMPKQYKLLLINCNKSVSTIDVFKMGFPTFSPKMDFEKNTNYDEMIFSSHNDLQANAIKLCPEIADVLEFLQQQQGCMLARMSGSGATCFGIFEDDATLNAAHQNTPKHWRSFIG